MGILGTEDALHKSKPKFREHYALVRRLTPQSQLLEYKLSDGWGPLCEFLGRPIPDKPFPHLNEKKWLDEKVKLAALRGLKGLLWKIAFTVLSLAIAVTAYFLYAS
jgi:hypothetical protein